MMRAGDAIIRAGQFRAACDLVREEGEYAPHMTMMAEPFEDDLAIVAIGTYNVSDPRSPFHHNDNRRPPWIGS